VSSLTVRVIETTYGGAVRAVQERAAEWFEEDPNCIAVELGPVATNTIAKGIPVDATATVSHEWSTPTYGFPKCRYCGKVSYR